MKKLLMLVMIGLFSCSLGYGQGFHHWSISAVKVNISEHWKGGADVEIRYRFLDGMYYHQLHFDLDYKLSKYFTIGISQRESFIRKSTWVVEHKPMLNLKFSSKWLKNRSRITLRIRDANDIWRFRNKTTLVSYPVFLVHEIFLEQGKLGIFRSRYYAGIYVNKTLTVFLLMQNTGDSHIVGVGTKLTVSF